MRPLLFLGSLCAALCMSMPAPAQVIEYEANGLKYQTTTRKGLTVIVTHLPNHVLGFGMLQVSLSNGSDVYWTVRPEDFAWLKQESAPGTMQALPANEVVSLLMARGTHSDVVKLVTSYEASLYGIPHMRSTNGYEQRRQNAMSYGMPSRLKAAATASAIALGQTRLAPGQSTDGAVFIPLTHDKSLANGKLIFRCQGETFEFNAE